MGIENLSISLRRMSAVFLIATVAVILSVFPVPAQDGGEEPEEPEDPSFVIEDEGAVFVPLPSTPSVDDSLTQALDAAETTFNDGLATMNESTLRRAAELYEGIIQDYPNDSRHFDAYFSSAYIHAEYLQTSADYEHAVNLLNLLITNHPSNYPYASDAYLVLAHISYRCLRDFQGAKSDLESLLFNPFLSQELGARDVEAKALLAKCYQKLGEYDKAQDLWEELNLSNPELDSEGRLQWIRDSENWFVVDDGRIRLFFENSIERDDYTECLSNLRDGLDMAESTWNLMPGGPTDVYLYSTSDRLFDFTLRSDGFALPTDGEIHMALADLDDTLHLTGWLASHRLNTRPDATAFPLLRAGFNHYFMGTRNEIDRLAAREIYYYGGRIEDIGLLYPLSFDYTFSEEYNAMASSFMHYLIEEGRVSTDTLKRFYRLLWANPRARMHAPLMSYLRRLNFEEGEARSWQQGLLSQEQVHDLFGNVLGVDITTELEDWQGTLDDEIEAVSSEFGSLTAEVERVDIDLSSPEKALETWWEAYRAGDFDGLIASSTREMASFFEEARQIYREEGIFDQVVLDYFIRPYRGARMVVMSSNAFTENIYVFEVQIEKGEEIEERTIVVRMEGNEWKVDSN